MDEKFFSDPAAVNKAIADFTDRISYQPTGPLLEEDRGLRFTLRRAAAIGKFSRELVNAYAQRTLALFDKQEIRDNPSSAAANQVSLYQNNLLGLRAQIFIDWRLRKPGAISVLTDVAY